MTSPSELVHLYALRDKPATSEAARVLLPRLRACLALLRSVRGESPAGEFDSARAVPICVSTYVMTCRSATDKWYVYTVLWHDSATQTVRECFMGCTLAFEWRQQERVEFARLALSEVAKAAADVEEQLRDAERLSAFDFSAAIATVRQRRAGREPGANIVLEKHEVGPRRSYPHWKEWDFETLELRPDDKVYRCTYTETDYGHSGPEIKAREEIEGAALMHVLRRAG
jgi:hypothetical protein